MGKFVVAVCDTEESYRDRFVTYLVSHKPGEVSVQAFTALEAFLDALMTNIYDVVLLGRGFREAERAVEVLGIPMLILKDSMPSYVAEDVRYQEEMPPKKAEVFRYQSVEAVLHEMTALAGGQALERARQEFALPGMEVIGVYSPVRHEMQMPFSLVSAAWLAGKKKVLYVNLMQYSGLIELFDLAGEHELGDIVLRLRNQRLLPENFLQCVYETEGLYYIPPFASPESLRELTPGDFGAFLEFLAGQTDFETAIIDFGEGLDGFAGMLERCTSIYCPVKSGYFYQCQVNQFLSWLESGTDGQVRERLHLLDLPFSAKRIRAGSGGFGQLLWSEFGDYVRSYLSGLA